jgi:hypothetical protein
MIVLMGGINNPNAKNQQTKPWLTKAHLVPLVQAYLLDAGLQENLPWVQCIDQLLTYESTTLAANISTNVQEHFVQKVKAFITTFLVKRRPDGFPKRVARLYARRVQRAVLQDDWDPHMTQNEVDIAQGLLDDLQMPVPVNSVPYDVKAHPMNVRAAF